MKNTSFLKQKSIKKLHFSLVLGAFSEFLQNRKIFTSTNFLRSFTVAPCKYTGDHRQIMGRSWAVSRNVQNYTQIVSNPYIITSAESALEYNKNPGFEPYFL